MDGDGVMEINSPELQEVEQRLKHEKSRRMFERYQTVRLHLLGKSNAEIATSIGRKESTVYTLQLISVRK
jgi:DNA-binding NarL/FixJ family response regulator